MNARQRKKWLQDHVDPVARQWYQRFSKQPSIEDCLTVLRQGNLQGGLSDWIGWELTDHAKDSPCEVIDAVGKCEEDYSRICLLMAIEIAVIPEALSLFAEILHSEIEPERECAIRGLQALNSKAARTVLFEAGVS